MRLREKQNKCFGEKEPPFTAKSAKLTIICIHSNFITFLDTFYKVLHCIFSLMSCTSMYYWVAIVNGASIQSNPAMKEFIISFYLQNCTKIRLNPTSNAFKCRWFFQMRLTHQQLHIETRLKRGCSFSSHTSDHRGVSWNPGPLFIGASQRLKKTE